jgi:hypothetical protein
MARFKLFNNDIALMGVAEPPRMRTAKAMAVMHNFVGHSLPNNHEWYIGRLKKRV